ncbi:hypothetical protein COLINT_03092 [Collinsella intestinalis DSM 13280]|uniref:Uncharacterized protein n=1 Tax=Collinsella intestinalis DSM 13280 TaxID=521003 RepID=C4FAK1_9ACTN|nr:hypothetical protein COLINT_03092 [Collinsella intestinalis DSM 13280]
MPLPSLKRPNAPRGADRPDILPNHLKAVGKRFHDFLGASPTQHERQRVGGDEHRHQKDGHGQDEYKGPKHGQHPAPANSPAVEGQLSLILFISDRVRRIVQNGTSRLGSNRFPLLNKKVHAKPSSLGRTHMDRSS